MGGCGFGWVSGGVEGGSYCRRLRPWWKHCAKQCHQSWSNFTACPPHPPPLTHTLPFTYNLPRCFSLISLSLSLAFFPLHLFRSLFLLSLPLPLSSPAQQRDGEDKNLQVALSSRDSDQRILCFSQESQEINKQRVRRGAAEVVKGQKSSEGEGGRGQKSDPGVDDGCSRE